MPRKSHYWIEVLRSFEGPGGKRLEPGDQIRMHRQAAEAKIRTRHARKCASPAGVDDRPEPRGSKPKVVRRKSSSEPRKPTRDELAAIAPADIKGWKAMGWPKARALFLQMYGRVPGNWQSISKKLPEIKRLKASSNSTGQKVRTEDQERAKIAVERTVVDNDRKDLEDAKSELDKVKKEMDKAKKELLKQRAEQDKKQAEMDALLAELKAERDAIAKEREDGAKAETKDEAKAK